MAPARNSGGVPKMTSAENIHKLSSELNAAPRGPRFLGLRTRRYDFRGAVCGNPRRLRRRSSRAIARRILWR
jgi:hypothetical protein